MPILKKILTPRLEWLIIPIIFSAIVWFVPYLFGAAYPQTNYPFQLFGTFTWFTLSAGWAHFIQFFCQIAIAIFLMRLCERWQLIPIRSAIPLVVGLFTMSTIAEIQFFDARMVALVLFLLAVEELFSMYSYSGEKVSVPFNIGFLITSAAFFQQEYIFLLVVFLLGMIVFSTFTVRAFCALLSGTLLPLFVFWSILFLSDNISFLYEILSKSHIHTFNQGLPILSSSVIFGAMLLLLFLISLTSYFSVSLNFKLHTRLNFFFINLAFILTTIWAGLFFYKFASLLIVPSMFLIVSVSFFFSTNQSKFANILFIVFLVSGLAYRVLNLIGI